MKDCNDLGVNKCSVQRGTREVSCTVLPCIERCPVLCSTKNKKLRLLAWPTFKLLRMVACTIAGRRSLAYIENGKQIGQLWAQQANQIGLRYHCFLLRVKTNHFQTTQNKGYSNTTKVVNKKCTGPTKFTSKIL
jgi:hypothetical protein